MGEVFCTDKPDNFVLTNQTAWRFSDQFGGEGVSVIELSLCGIGVKSLLLLFTETLPKALYNDAFGS